MSDQPRRRFLHLSGVTIATVLAGCGGDGGNGDGGNGDADGDGDAVPSQYETAEALGGMERNPDSLIAKGDVNYQEEPSGGQQCSECQYYIEDMNGDGMGACAIVEGTIDPEGWCSSYSPV